MSRHDVARSSLVSTETAYYYHCIIQDDTLPILARLGIDPAGLLDYLSRRERGFYQVMGTSQAIREAVTQLGRGFLKGITAANRLFVPAVG